MPNKKRCLYTQRENVNNIEIVPKSRHKRKTEIPVCLNKRHPARMPKTHKVLVTAA